MLSEYEKSKIIERYRERFDKFGYSPKTLGWFKGRQILRFHTLAEIDELKSGDTLLDVGCGFGDLYNFLNKHQPGVKYTGIDINPQLIEVGKQIYPNSDLRVGDILQIDLGKFDWVVASGVFNHILVETANDAFIKEMISKMFDIARKGVAVDFMSTYVDFKQEHSYHTAPEWIFSFAKTLSRRVTLRHDYMPYEFCIYIYKDETIGRRNVFKLFEKWLEEDVIDDQDT